MWREIMATVWGVTLLAVGFVLAWVMGSCF